jgi:4'-phosphopantetheinyl transferase
MNSFETTFCKISLSDFHGSCALQDAWQKRPAAAALGDDEVHLWLANVELVELSPDVLLRVLSEEERTRAAGFHFDRDRHRYVARRALLRQLIGEYLQKAPDEIGFAENSFGKSELAGETGVELQFNLSTSAEWVIYGFNRQRKIGVDIEKVRPEFNWSEIAAKFFHPREGSDIGKLPESEQVGAFFTYWTLKEAFLKAHGVGLQRPLVEFDFTPVVREGKKQFTDTDGSEWLCTSLRPGAGLAAGLVIEA